MMLSEQIGTAAHQVLEKTPPELAGEGPDSNCPKDFSKRGNCG